MKASSASAGAANVNAMVAMVPAMNEPMAAVASAAAPRPARAILLPSRAVIIEPASPGVLIRIDVVEPPYIAPYKTPANIINADTGPTDTVTGNSKAIVKAGPIPGKIPMAVPSTEPTKAHIRFVGVSATSNPCNNSPNVSITYSPRARNYPVAGPAIQTIASRQYPASDQ